MVGTGDARGLITSDVIAIDDTYHNIYDVLQANYEGNRNIHPDVDFEETKLWYLINICCIIIDNYFDLWCFTFLPHLSWKLKWAFLIVCRPPVRTSVCKLSTFSSSFPLPLGRFQSNLAQGIIVKWLNKKKLKYIKIKGHVQFQRKTITKLRKYIDKMFSLEALGQFYSNLAHSILGQRRLNLEQIRTI